MDAPKKFTVDDFLGRMRTLYKQYGVAHTDIPSALVFKRDMTLLPWPSSVFKTLKEHVSGMQQS